MLRTPGLDARRRSQRYERNERTLYARAKDTSHGSAPLKVWLAGNISNVYLGRRGPCTKVAQPAGPAKPLDQQCVSTAPAEADALCARTHQCGGAGWSQQEPEAAGERLRYLAVLSEPTAAAAP